MVSECFAAFSKSIDFIEANLKESITVKTIADRAANYSVYHFVRLFYILTGETPGSYLRKRRLSESARELLDMKRSILDVAVSYRFGSHEAFTRSFKKHFGITPRELRQNQSFLHLTSPAVIAPAQSSRNVSRAPEIERQPNLLLAGLAYHGDNSNFELPGLWQNLMRQLDQIPERRSPQQTYGLWRYPEKFQTDRNFDYLAGVSVETLAGLPSHFARTELRSDLYARFEHHGSLKFIRQTFIYIYGEWLPKSRYRPAGNYDMEFYDERFSGTDQEDSVLNILVPVKAN